MFNMKLIFDTTGDQIDVDVINPNFVEFWLDNINDNDNKLSLIDHDIKFELQSDLKNNLKKTNQILAKFAIQPLMDPEEDWYDQHNLNILHEKWVKLQHNYPSVVNALTMLGDSIVKDFYNINMLIHSIESKKSIVYEKFNNNKTTWQRVNNFSTDILSNGSWNIEIGYQNLGRSLFEKWSNLDDNVNDEDTNNFTHFGSRVIINISRPFVSPLPTEYLSYCDKNGVAPINPILPMGNFKNYQKNLKEIRHVIYRNVQQNNRISFEK